MYCSTSFALSPFRVLYLRPCVFGRCFFVEQYESWRILTWIFTESFPKKETFRSGKRKSQSDSEKKSGRTDMTRKIPTSESAHLESSHESFEKKSFFLNVQKKKELTIESSNIDINIPVILVSFHVIKCDQMLYPCFDVLWFWCKMPQ